MLKRSKDIFFEVKVGVADVEEKGLTLVQALGSRGDRSLLIG